MDKIITETEVKNDIKYTTHYVDRPIKPGDKHGGSIGACINGIEKTIEIITYVYGQENWKK